MIDLSTITGPALAAIKQDVSWLATNADIRIVAKVLMGAAAGIATVAKAILYVRKLSTDIAAGKVVAQMFEQTRVASFSKSDVRDAITGYVWPDASSIDPSDEADLRNVPVQGPLLDAILKATSAARERLHLILLADSGMGKTTFCINFYAKFRKTRKVAIVPLGRADAIEVIKAIPFPQETMLFLDALDEDAVAIRDKETRFAELMESAKNFQHVIVTCRSQFFLHDDDIPAGSRIIRLGPRKAGEAREYPMRRLYLAPFSPEQIEQYVKSHFPWYKLATFRARARARQMVASIPELSVRPMLLALVPDLVKDHTTKSELFELYEYMVDKWLQRESDWIDQTTLLSISKSLAVRLYVQQQNGGMDRLSPEELGAIADSYGNDAESWKLTSRSLLNRDINGYYKFAHRSILEYLFVSATLDGREECFRVPWTHLMTQLLISRHVATNGGDLRVTAIFDRDLAETGMLPLLKRESHPILQSRSGIVSIVQSGGIDADASRINESWVMKSYRVKEDDGVTTLTDLVRGVTWRFISSAPAGDDPRIYMEPLSSIAREVSYELGLLNRPSGVVPEPVVLGRLPSTLEMLWLYGYLQSHRDAFGKNFPGAWLLESHRLFWLGDALKGGGFLTCTFNEGDEPHAPVRIASIGDSKGNGGFAVYEIAHRPGVPWNPAFSAFAVRVRRGLLGDSKGGGAQGSDNAMEP
ncbi:hypothetical protein OKW43_005139 [Paraburkholderia sp. WC7.3g]|uniref:NACHT domain-containing protein n=1 Tax=Paraburkholderia sp. WC7.3g TaxID=2991070 RepID=UPI003D1D0716